MRPNESSARRWVRRLAWTGWAVLAGFAYRQLLRPEPLGDLPAALEDWFFAPSQRLSSAVLAVCLWLVYRRWGGLRALPPGPRRPLSGWALLLAGLAVHLWATHTGAEDLMALALALTAAGAVWCWKGRAGARRLALPLAVLLLAIPVPAPLMGALIFRLQLWTAQISSALLYLLGVPHLLAAERIDLADSTFTVIESCSGLRSMETLLLVSILMMDLFRRPALHAWLVVLAALPVAFALNGLRALLLILNPHSQIASIHNLQGVAILLTGLLLLFAGDGLVERFAGSGPSEPARREPAQAVPRLPLLKGCLVLAALASLLLPRFHPPRVPPLQLSRYFGSALGVSRDVEVEPLFLGSAGFREVFERRFEGEAPVYLFLGVGERARRQASALSPKTRFPGSGWFVEEDGWVELPDARRAERRVLRRGSRRFLVYHWVENAGGLADESLRSALGLDRSPWARPGEILVVRLRTPLEAAGPLPGEKELLSFYRSLRPQLDTLDRALRGKDFHDFPSSGKHFPPRTGGQVPLTP